MSAVRRVNKMIEKTSKVLCIIMNELKVHHKQTSIELLNIKNALHNAEAGCGISINIKNIRNIFDVKHIPDINTYKYTRQIMKYINHNITKNEIPFDNTALETFMKACVEVGYSFPTTLVIIRGQSLGIWEQDARTAVENERINAIGDIEDTFDKLKDMHMNEVARYNTLANTLAEIKHSYNTLQKTLKEMKLSISVKEQGLHNFAHEHQLPNDYIVTMQKVASPPKSIA